MIRRGFVWPTMIAMVLSAGCGSAPTRTEFVGNVERETILPAVGEPLTVEVGDAIFVKGSYVKHPAFELRQRYEGTIPGAYSIPFSFWINPSTLHAAYSRGSRDFFCAPPSKRSASFPGLGVVVEPNDCIGISRDQETGDLRWVVDNSHYNNQTTVWSKPVSPEDRALLQERTPNRPSQWLSGMMIYFDGYYSDLLHFRVVDHTGNSSQEFRFDYPSKTGSSVYGIRGNEFEVLDVSNTEMTYKWIRVDG